jgi:hypothetical protein
MHGVRHRLIAAGMTRDAVAERLGAGLRSVYQIISAAQVAA